MMQALNDKDSLHLSALQLSTGIPETKIDWNNFDIDQIPEELVQRIVDYEKPKFSDPDNVVLDPWIFTEQKEKTEIVEMQMPIRRFDV